MKNEQDISETIEAYLANSLSSEDKIAFETRLQNEPDLAKALADEKALSHLLLENELFSLRDQMKSDFQEAKQSRLFKLKAIGFVAISAIVAAGVFMVLPKEEPALVSEIIVKTDSFTDSSKKEPTILINNNSYIIASKKTTISTKNIPEEHFEEAVLIEENPRVAFESSAPVQNVEKEILNTEKQDISPKVPSIEKTIETHFQTKPTEKDQQNDSIKIQLANEPKKKTLCVGDYPKSFSPEFDPAWLVPIAENESAKVIIKDKTGTTVFEKQHFTSNEISWDGNSLSGGQAVTGSYKVFISYQNGENCIATVTLFR